VLVLVLVLVALLVLVLSGEESRGEALDGATTDRQTI
jgi:hypothetical protein